MTINLEEFHEYATSTISNLLKQLKIDSKPEREIMAA